MKNSINGHLCIVFAQEHYNPLGLIRGLGENGIFPVYVSIKRRGEVATKSKFISKLHHVDSVIDGYNLVMAAYGNFDYEHRPFILFSDDKSIGYFDLHYEEIKDKFIIFNAGASGKINKYMDKNAIMLLAQKHGFNIIDSWVVNTGDIPKDLIYPILTKDISPNSGSWKSDVFICQNEAELKNAYTMISSPIILIQRFIDKENELALQGYAIDHGRQIQIITAMNWKYLIKGYYSPYHNVRMFNDLEMEQKLQEIFVEIGYEGIFEVEFLTTKENTNYFLEINFRASAWNHTTNFAGMSEAYLWIKGMLNGYIDSTDRKEFEEFTSMSEIIDFGKRVDSGMISFQEWLKEFKEAKCTYYYNKYDMGPYDYVSDKWDQYK